MKRQVRSIRDDSAGWLCALAALIASGTSGAAVTRTSVKTLDDMPADVATLYKRTCPAEYWASGQRALDGSATAGFSDGTQVYLMVCGSAASVVPYEIIVMPRSGAPAEARFHWTLRGRNVGASGLANAHFGAATDTVVTSSHSSATCEPEYTHRWTGEAFDLVRLNRAGCRPGE